MNRKLTREEAIELHRKMWTDMQAELGDEPEPYKRMDFKREWAEEHFPGEDITSHCFLCEYAKQLDEANSLEAKNRCEYCPIKWNSVFHPICNPGIFDFWERNKIDYRYSPISVILTLPEREVVE